MKKTIQYLFALAVAGTVPVLASPATFDANVIVTGGAGSPITISVPTSFSFTLGEDFTGYSLYLVAREAFSESVGSPAYGYLTTGTGVYLTTSTGGESYSAKYTAGSTSFGTDAFVLEFEFDGGSDEAASFVAGTLFTIHAGSVDTSASPDAAAPDNSAPYAFAVTDGNNHYYTPSAVPEPSVCAALAGVGALAYALWRRRRSA